MTGEREALDAANRLSDAEREYDEATQELATELAEERTLHQRSIERVAELEAWQDAALARLAAVEAEIASWTHHVSEDCWYTCAAATEEREGEECCDDARRGGECDCGLEYRRARIRAALAGVPLRREASE